MQYELLSLLKCPLTKTNLRFELISEFEKTYADINVREVSEGLLFSDTGLVFPVIDGIPRMLVEAMYDYSVFLQEHLPAYAKIKQAVDKNLEGVLTYCREKNRKTKASFQFEWDFLDSKKQDKVWNEGYAQLSTVLMEETGEGVAFFKDARIIDVGCGHGIMTSRIAEVSQVAVGVELSRAVENAFSRNQQKNAFYIQGDLQFLPFQDGSFNVLYSSGVIHHTNNTELSLSLIEPVLQKGGKICLWLYHPQKNALHQLILLARKVTSRLPLKLAFVFLLVFIFPVSFFVKKIKRKTPPNYREEIIDLLDQFTPEFRFEIPQDLATTWLKRRSYADVKITTSNQFGFSIAGLKQKDDERVGKEFSTELPDTKI